MFGAEKHRHGTWSATATPPVRRTSIREHYARLSAALIHIVFNLPTLQCDCHAPEQNQRPWSSATMVTMNAMITDSIKQQKHLHTYTTIKKLEIFRRFDLFQRPLSEKAGTHFFWILTRWPTVVSRKRSYVRFWLCNMNLFSNIEFQPISWKPEHLLCSHRSISVTQIRRENDRKTEEDKNRSLYNNQTRSKAYIESYTASSMLMILQQS